MAQSSDNKTDLSNLCELGRRIVELRHKIFERFEVQVRAKISKAKDVSHPILIDTLPIFISNLAQALTPQNSRQAPTEGATVAQEHGSERARLTDYGVEHIVGEYQLLRIAIYDVLNEEKVVYSGIEARSINTFIDEAVQQSVIAFAVVQADLREKFIAILSHDLRNPLASAQMAAQLILRDPVGEKVPELATRMVESLRRMDSMLQNLLDATMVKSGGRLALDISECDMLDLVKASLAQRNVANNPRFKVDGVPCRGFWSSDALRRAYDNLIANAVKYGDPEKPISIRIRSEEGRVLVSVHNDGMSIPVNDQEGIFQVFRRSTAAKNSGQKGWGLGLALVRGVAESHGGSVIVDSAPDRGTTFTIDIPIDARPFQNAPVS